MYTRSCVRTDCCYSSRLRRLFSRYFPSPSRVASREKSVLYDDEAASLLLLTLCQDVDVFRLSLLRQLHRRRKIEGRLTAPSLSLFL